MAKLAAVNEALKLGVGVLDNISESYYENDAMFAYWNDWQARDQQARIQKTFDNGRFSRKKRTLGIVNGRWYCCYKQDALISLGQELD